MNVIVAKYKEDIEWTKQIKDATVTIYDKSGSKKSDFPKLKNIGRESHTYLHHIIENYDCLDDYNVFSQGHPFDHCPRFLELLPNAYGKHYYDFELLTCNTLVTDEKITRFGVQIFDSMNAPLAVNTIKLFKPKHDFTKSFPVSYYGIFSASRENILKYSKETYIQALERHKNYTDMPYIFEIAWRLIYA